MVTDRFSDRSSPGRYLSDNWAPVIEKDVERPNSLPRRIEGEKFSKGRQGLGKVLSRNHAKITAKRAKLMTSHRAQCVIEVCTSFVRICSLSPTRWSPTFLIRCLWSVTNCLASTDQSNVRRFAHPLPQFILHGSRRNARSCWIGAVCLAGGPAFQNFSSTRIWPRLGNL